MQKKIQKIKRFLLETIKQCTFLTIGAVVIAVLFMLVLGATAGIKIASFSEIVLATAIFYSVLLVGSSIVGIIIILIGNDKK